MRGRRKRREARWGRGRVPSAGWVWLHGEFYPQIRSWFADRVATEQDADDLAEQVFADLAPGRTPDNPKAYLAATAANVLSRYRRRRAKERAILRKLVVQAVIARDGEQPHEAGEPSGDEGLGAEHDEFIEEVLGGLPAEQAELLRLRFVEGLHVAEVARRVGCSRGAAYKRIQRTIMQLRERYGIKTNRPADGENRENL